MSLSPGTRFGPYKITALIGAGGMGEVYRARDTQLDRDVAIKILPDTFAADPDRLQRFEREAKTLATLNHPHIAQIHGVEHSGTTRALVMELVEGEDLSQRIAQGPIPMDEARSIGRQIAEALEAAHDRGVVHRDLKPANIKLTANDTVKVLDFGLAKAVLGDSADGSLAALNSPTITSPAMTRAGVILGTAAYMAPEQARGRVVDKRADIWAFGVVLYEMLTARRAFDGETVSDMLAAVLTREVDMTALPADTPLRVRHLLTRCLTRDPRARLRDIGEARIALEGTDATEVTAPSAARPSSRRPWLLAGAGGVAGAALATAVAGGVMTPPAMSPPPVMHLSIPLAPDAPMALYEDGSLAISRKGTHIAYVGDTKDGTRLFLRALDQPEFTTVAGTEGAARPFFSADGAWLGFSAGGRLRKVPVAGGSPVTITEVSGSPVGAFWADDDTIVFSPSFTTGLVSVPAAGGAPRPLVTVDRSRHEGALLWPQVLPGGVVLFTADPDSTASYNDAQVVLQIPDRPETRQMLAGGTYGRYLSTGHLMFGHDARILVAPLDLAGWRLTAPAVPVVSGVAMSVINGLLFAAVSDTGVLAYVPGGLIQAGPDNLMVIDRTGRVEPMSPAYPFDLRDLNLSPDGRRVAMRVAKANDDIHVFDSVSGTFSRFTADGGDEMNPVWTRDGQRIVYGSSQAGNLNLYWRAADGSGGSEPLLSSPNQLRASSVSPDGALLAYTESHPETELDIWVVPLGADRTPRPVLRTRFAEQRPVFSPDGAWLAYESDESGRSETYVMRFPDGRDKRQISVAGGTQPLWSTDGRELYFLDDDWMMAASLATASGTAAPKRLFQYPFTSRSSGLFYAVRPDGRFIVVKRDNGEPIRQIRVVVNWFEDLKSRVPVPVR